MRFFGAVGLILGLGACEALPAGDLANVWGGLGQPASEDSLSRSDIDAGLRQALEIGTSNVTAQLGQADGFFGDDQIRIPLPGRIGQLQNQLTKVGLSGPLDDLQLRMNRAASAAMPEAKTLVLQAVQSITLQDALGILRGGNSAATDYLRSRTETSLQAAFTPYMQDALTNAGAFQAFDQVTSQYQLSGLSNALRRDMTESAVTLGLDGMFYYIAEEERKIRENPVARTTELLRRVFGSI